MARRPITPQGDTALECLRFPFLNEAKQCETVKDLIRYLNALRDDISSDIKRLRQLPLDKKVDEKL